MRTIAFTGIDRRGVAHTGRAGVDDLVTWVRNKYLDGWRRLSVYEPGAGNLIAEITPGLDRPGSREWWAER